MFIIGDGYFRDNYFEIVPEAEQRAEAEGKARADFTGLKLELTWTLKSYKITMICIYIDLKGLIHEIH
jgi:hypothetical protein